MAEGAVADSEMADGRSTAATDAADGADAAAGPDDPCSAYIERFASVLVAAGFPPCRPGSSSRCWSPTPAG